MRHVDEGTLHALLDGALRAEEPDRAREVEAHLESCADCRARLEQAEDLRDRAGQLLTDLEVGTPSAATPDFQEVLARARTEEAPQGRPAARTPDRIRRQAAWTRGLAWAATIVVALGTGYLVRDLAGPTGVVPGRSTMERAAPAAADAVERMDDAEPAGPAESTTSPEGEVAPGEAEGPPDPTATRTEPAAEAGQPVSRTADQAAAPPAAPRQRAESGAADRAAEEMEAAVMDQLRQAESEGAALPVAEPLGNADGVQKAVESAPPIIWVEAGLAEAEARVGPILVLPDAEIAATEVPQGDEPLARTLQVLAGGMEIRVVQQPGQATGESVAADVDAAAPPARPEPTALRAREPAMAETGARLVSGPDSGAYAAAGARTVTLERDGLVLTLTGPLPAEALLSLAGAAAPRQR